MKSPKLLLARRWPPQLRARFASLGLCKNESAETAHFPPALYVLESRRMKGQYVISQKDILDLPEKDDAIAISSFLIDSHNCQRVALKDGGVINECTISPCASRIPRLATPSMCPTAPHCPSRSSATTCSCPSRFPARMLPFHRCASRARGWPSAKVRASPRRWRQNRVSACRRFLIQGGVSGCRRKAMCWTCLPSRRHNQFRKRDCSRWIPGQGSCSTTPMRS